MLKQQVADIRAFNRFYTRVIGLLNKYILNSSFTLPEVRVLYEIYYHESITAGEIVQALGIDKSYLSRMLATFEKKKLVAKKRSGEDARILFLLLTARGRKEFEMLDAAQYSQIENILKRLSSVDCEMLVTYMTEIKKILAKAAT